jgi:hypothetical protein
MWNCGEAVGRATKRRRREGETGARRTLGCGKTMEVSPSMVLEWSAKERGRNRNRNRAIVRGTGRSRFRWRIFEGESQVHVRDDRPLARGRAELAGMFPLRLLEQAPRRVRSGPVLCIMISQEARSFPRMLADGLSSLMESAMRTMVSHTKVLIRFVCLSVCLSVCLEFVQRLFLTCHRRSLNR